MKPKINPEVYLVAAEYTHNNYVASGDIHSSIVFKCSLSLFL